MPKKCSNYHTIALISHASKYPKFSKCGFNSTWTEKFQMFKLDWEKAEEPEIKLLTYVGSSKKQESYRKASTSDLLTMSKHLCGSQQNVGSLCWKLWKILKEMGIPDHLTCLLGYLYADQETVVRTRHGTMGNFQTGKGVCQNCILSLCLFNLYAEYIKCEMWSWMKHKLESRLPRKY